MRARPGEGPGRPKISSLGASDMRGRPGDGSPPRRPPLNIPHSWGVAQWLGPGARPRRARSPDLEGNEGPRSREAEEYTLSLTETRTTKLFWHRSINESNVFRELGGRRSIETSTCTSSLTRYIIHLLYLKVRWRLSRERSLIARSIELARVRSSTCN